MKDLGRQVTYWDIAGAEKTFTHPVDLGWLATVDREARILDYGCGYGRVMAELSRQGFSDVSGPEPRRVPVPVTTAGRQTALTKLVRANTVEAGDLAWKGRACLVWAGLNFCSSRSWRWSASLF